MSNRKPWTKWTQEDKDQLTQLFEKHTHVEIAAIMGRPLGSVQSMASTLGLLKRNLKKGITKGRIITCPKPWITVCKRVLPD